MDGTFSESAGPIPASRVEELLADCLSLAADMARGEAPPEKLARLEESVRSLAGADRETVERLLRALASARDAGADWLRRVAAPELESLARERRGLDAYRQRGRPA